MKSFLVIIIAWALACVPLVGQAQSKEVRMQEIRAKIEALHGYQATVRDLLNELTNKKVRIMPFYDSSGKFESVLKVKYEDYEAYLARKVLLDDWTSADVLAYAKKVNGATEAYRKNLAREAEVNDEYMDFLQRKLSEIESEKEGKKGDDSTPKPPAQKVNGYRLEGYSEKRDGIQGPANWTEFDGKKISYRPSWGKITYTISMPDSLSAGGEDIQLEIACTSNPGSRTAGYMVVKGDVDFSESPTLESLAESGQSTQVSKTVRVTTRSGDAKEILVVVSLQDGPSITYRYVR